MYVIDFQCILFLPAEMTFDFVQQTIISDEVYLFILKRYM